MHQIRLNSKINGTLTNFYTYCENVWGSRYFWMQLAFSDLRIKYRRSYLGIMWAIFQPLCMTLLLAVVMGNIFKTPIAGYMPFIFSGLILWDFIVSSAVSGCQAFILAEGYIKQFAHPIIIYTLRSTLTALLNLLLASVGFFIFIVISKPGNFGLSWLTLCGAYFILFFYAWGLATIFAFITIRFRDFSQLIIIIFQAIWYVSPVFIQPKIFMTSKLHYLIDYNPVYHLLQLFRAPLLYGNVAQGVSWWFSIVALLCIWLMCIYTILKNENRVVFYL